MSCDKKLDTRSLLLDATAVLRLVREDGLRVLIIHTGALGRIAHVQVDIRVGDDNEGGTGPQAGSPDRETAHYLEHLVACLLQSRKYPGGEAKRLTERHGISSNAFTSAVRTSHYMSGHAKLLAEMIDVQVGALADFPQFFDELAASPRFAMEKEAVLEELADRIGVPDFEMYEAINAQVFAGHPRAVSQRFDVDNVRRLTPAGVRAFVDKYYVARNMMVTVAGPDALCGVVSVMRQLEQYRFGRPGAPAAAPVPLPNPFETRINKARVVYVPVAGAKTMRISMIWPCRLREYEQTAALGALSHVLTGGFESRLLKRLRVDDGLVYSVSAGADLDERNAAYGTYQIVTSVTQGKVARLVSETFLELRRLVRDGPTAEEMREYTLLIETAQEYRILDRKPGSWVDDYANQALFADTDEAFTTTAIVSNAERYARKLAVTAEDVRKLAADTIGFLTNNMLFVYSDARDSTDVICKALRDRCSAE